MAPESTNNTTETETTRQILAVPAPEAGEAVAVRSAAGSELDFAFNPSEAIVSRDGNSLVFELDNGGTVTLVNFFAVGDQPLPDFRLPDGVVVGSLDFFAGSDIDVSTAAPGGTAPGSGLGAYDGDPGAFTDGIDRLSDQGSFYWGREVEAGREDQGYGLVGGTFGMDAITFGQVLAYEDARPFQHLDNPPQGQADFSPARLTFLPQPLPGNSVNEVRLSGLPEGAKIYTLDPQTGEYVLIAQPADGVYRFQESDFMDPAGVYIAPPADSDDEFTLNVSVDFNYNGLITTVGGNVTVFVDAVADRPEDVATGGIYDPADQAYESGTPGRINVQAEFGDYNDNSETHYLVIHKGDVIDNVDPASLPGGMSLLTPAEAAQFGSDTGVSGDYWVIEVSNEYLQDHNGAVDLDLGVSVKDYATDQTGLVINTEAVAVEYQGYNTVTSPGEAYADNNVSRVEGQAEVSVSVISSEIEVGVSKPAYEDNMAEAHVGDSTPDAGARIDISGLATGDNESVTKIVLTIDCQYDEGAQQYVGGSFVY
ncbi:MAG: hypothetical protein LBM64_03600, partial [Deltaproteobacteria bacterium]|nr:hypothetical protein [Deltaproteobacteria bacterium]